MRHVPNTVYPFQQLKLGKRVIFWRILSESYDSADRRYDPRDNDFRYIYHVFDDVDDELLKTAQRYLNLGYCPAININGEETVSGVTCSLIDKFYYDNPELIM